MPVLPKPKIKISMRVETFNALAEEALKLRKKLIDFR
jgi:hypothetical protein